MQESLILKVITKIITYPMFLLSLWIMMRGHNYPGGGFIGGLVGVAAVIVNSITLKQNKEYLKKSNKAIFVAVIGLLCALVSALISIIFQKAFMVGLWINIDLGERYISLGTPMLFDFGIYLVVIGGLVQIFNKIKEHL